MRIQWRTKHIVQGGDIPHSWSSVSDVNEDLAQNHCKGQWWKVPVPKGIQCRTTKCLIGAHTVPVFSHLILTTILWHDYYVFFMPILQMKKIMGTETSMKVPQVTEIASTKALEPVPYPLWVLSSTRWCMVQAFKDFISQNQHFCALRTLSFPTLWIT